MPRKSAQPAESGLVKSATQQEKHDILKLLAEKRERLKDPLRIYEPLPYQQKFHECRARECIIQKGNRSGGSIAGFVEDARCVRGLDPYKKYPTKGVLVCIGYGEPHIGTIIWPHLFDKGMGGNFTIIKDLKTKEWRSFRPWEPDRAILGRYGDWGRETDCELSPPLIPDKYFVEEPAWDNKKERIFSIVRIKTETTEYEIRAYNSNGDWRQAQGFNANLVHFDEDIADGGWFKEMVARTNFVQGLIRWTAKPADENDEMANMVERAEEQAELTNPRSVCFVASPEDNPYYSSLQKADDAAHWKSMGEDVYEQRYMGKFTTNKLRMYPTFNRSLHNVMRDDCPAEKIHKVLKDSNGVPPADWCRYAAIDPGHQVCAVLFGAVPPMDLWSHKEGHVVIYDELYIRQCDAFMFGEKFAKKADGWYWDDFIIDAHGAALRDIGSGLTPREQYSKQLADRNIESRRSKSGFHDGCDEPSNREVVMRDWLRIRDGGCTKLMIVADRVPNFVREMEGFRHKVNRAGGTVTVLDDGDRKRNTHAVEAGEYMVSHGLPYVRPLVSESKMNMVERIMRFRRQKRLKRRGEMGNPKAFSFGARGA